MNKRMKAAMLFMGIVLIWCMIFYREDEKTEETVSKVSETEIPEEENISLSWKEEKETLTEEEQKERLEEIKEQAREQNVPERVISLIDQNEETVDFVRDYPENYQEEPAETIESSYQEGEIPQLLQWDERWGYQTYGKGTIANCGCGPTCVSMVISGLTGRTEVTPYVVACYSEEHQLIDENDNTYWQLMTDMPEEYGLKVEETMLSEAGVAQALSEGKPIICSMGPGDFTDEGHFVVLTAYADGIVKVHDPFSQENSDKEWVYREISDQIKQMWVYDISGR